MEKSTKKCITYKCHGTIHQCDAHVFGCTICDRRWTDEFVFDNPETLGSRIYLAGPMRGHPDHNFDAFNKAAAWLRSEGYRVFNPAENDVASKCGEATSSVFSRCMERDLPEVCKADAIVLLPGWEKSQGAQLEFKVATECGKEKFLLNVGESDGDYRLEPFVPDGFVIRRDEKGMACGITRFESGAIRDSQEGKSDYVETNSMFAEERYARYMTEKKKKYGSGNFKKGIPKSSYIRSLWRHVVKFTALEDCKEHGWPTQSWMEPDQDHLSGIRFNVNGLMHEEEVSRK